MTAEQPTDAEQRAQERRTRARQHLDDLRAELAKRRSERKR